MPRAGRDGAGFLRASNSVCHLWVRVGIAAEMRGPKDHQFEGLGLPNSSAVTHIRSPPPIFLSEGKLLLAKGLPARAEYSAPLRDRSSGFAHLWNGVVTAPPLVLMLYY